jgi:ATP-binding cassette, subfamily B, bacterial PglK
MNDYLKIFELLNKRERRQGSWLMLMVFMMAILDVIGIASIMPFMAVLANPQLVDSNTYLNLVYISLGFTDVKTFLYFLGLMVFIILFTTLCFKAVTNYFLFRFTLMSEYKIGGRVIESYLGQPYAWFLDRNSAILGKSLLSEVNQVIQSGLLPIVNVIAQGALIVIIVAFLVIINYQLSLAVGSVLIITYFVLFKSTGVFLSKIGVSRLEANDARFLAVNELFGAIKEIKVSGLERTYISRFKIPSKIYANHQASAMVVSQLPRFALEGITFGGMLGVILYLMKDGEGIVSMLPVISVYAFAAYRLMPAVQQIYSGVSQLSFAIPAIKTLHSSLHGDSPRVEDSQEQSLIRFKREITFQDVSFRYDSASRGILQDISLTIPSGNRIGIVGSSGSGKTTTVDILLGLLEPQSGVIKVDGTVIDRSNRRNWQKSIGYVPQHIYLADDTLTANIAFGQDEEKIDFAAVEIAAKRALLHDFVISEMPLGYKTLVGERGVRLSGGQRQRIGIARALYRNPSLLILDEATSALDNITERLVMNAMHDMGNITIVMIAHRLSTIRECDSIILLDNGNIKKVGTYDQLLKNSETFRAMARQEVNK